MTPFGDVIDRLVKPDQGGFDGFLPAWDDISGIALDSMQIQGFDLQPLGPAGGGVDLELASITLISLRIRRDLVVNDGEGAFVTALFIKNHVGTAGQNQIRESNFEGALRRPDPLEVFGVLPHIRQGDLLCPLHHRFETWPRRIRDEHLALDDFLDFGFVRRAPRCLGKVSQRSHDMVDSLAIPQFLGDWRLEAKDTSQAIAIAAIVVRRHIGVTQLNDGLVR